MSPYPEIVLHAPVAEEDAAKMEAVLASLTRLGLVSAWRREADGSYCVEANPQVANQLAILVGRSGQRALAEGTHLLQ